MIKNYFKIALRNLWNSKVTGFINLFGLSVGMKAAVFIFLWVQNETSYDSYQPNKNDIYRITHDISVSKDEVCLAAFTAERHTKEIGIPKVLGESVNALVRLLSEDFIKLVLIALLIASPIAWWLKNKWLQDFAYPIDLSWWKFGLAAVFAISISVLTVS